MRLTLFVSSSAVDTDFTAGLGDVFPDGRPIQLQSGMLRECHSGSEPELMEPGRIYRLELDMWATANRFRRGHRTARFCINNGADMVVGHHHPTMRGMEWSKGKPIIYGLGHFVFDFVLGTTAEQFDNYLLDLGPADCWDTPNVAGPRDGWPCLPMHEDMRMTMIAWARADRTGVQDIGFLPCKLAPDGSVYPLELGSPESDELTGYFEKAMRTQRLCDHLTTEIAISLAGFAPVRVAPGDGVST